MATMNVSLPEEMKSWAEAQTEHGRYSNVSDYMRDLIRRDQHRAKAIADLEALIAEGIDSGVSPLTMDEIFDEAMKAADATGPVNG